jgi:regulator of sirC expression with transglutaminase-like and TPR domain
MKASATVSPAAPLSDGQRAALIKLLADEDQAVYHAIRQKILSCGHPASIWLRPYALSEDPLTRRRVQEILDHLARQAADDQFLAFCLNQGEEFDVEQAAWMLALSRYPDVNVAAYSALLDSYAGDLRERSGPPRATLEALNEHLFEQLGFRGNEADYYDPDNSYLNRVVDRRTGNPISLSLVYLFLARRLQLPVTGIAMPGHFICRFQTSIETLYIDVFNQGRFLSKAECIRYLQQANGSQDVLLRPATPRRILLRMCSNLHQIYLQLRLKDETARLQRYVVALAKARTHPV